jgi:hypothetical protein
MQWKIGDKCFALWEDGVYYAGVIKFISNTKDYTILFTQHGNRHIVTEKDLVKDDPRKEIRLMQGILPSKKVPPLLLSLQLERKANDQTIKQTINQSTN